MNWETRQRVDKHLGDPTAWSALGGAVIGAASTTAATRHVFAHFRNVFGVATLQNNQLRFLDSANKHNVMLGVNRQIVRAGVGICCMAAMPAVAKASGPAGAAGVGALFGAAAVSFSHILQDVLPTVFNPRL